MQHGKKKSINDEKLKAEILRFNIHFFPNSDFGELILFYSFLKRRSKGEKDRKVWVYISTPKELDGGARSHTIDK